MSLKFNFWNRKDRNFCVDRICPCIKAPWRKANFAASAKIFCALFLLVTYSFHIPHLQPTTILVPTISFSLFVSRRYVEKKEGADRATKASSARSLFFFFFLAARLCNKTVVVVVVVVLSFFSAEGRKHTLSYITDLLETVYNKAGQQYLVVLIPLFWVRGREGSVWALPFLFFACLFWECYVTGALHKANSRHVTFFSIWS